MLTKLCANKSEIIFLQEHWQTFEQLNNFDAFKSEYNIFGSSAMGSVVEKGILRGRPWGGLCSLISTLFCNLFNTVSCVACCDRFIILMLDNLMLINVYFPCCQSAADRDDLCSLFSQIGLEVADLKYTYAVMGGDINCNVLLQSETAQFINEFVSKVGLTVCNKLLTTPAFIEYTFNAVTRGAYSTIDFFFITDCIPNFARSLNIIQVCCKKNRSILVLLMFLKTGLVKVRLK